MEMSRRKMILSSMALAPYGSAFAQADYPAMPVKIVVGFAAGGSTDQIARVIADGLTTRLNRPFLVDNRPGASGNLAAGQVARATGDGYTLLLTAVGLATTAAFNPKIQQAHPTTDLAPISLLAFTPNVLLASPRTNIKTMADLLAYGKANPGKLEFGHSGYGGGLHLTGEIFAVRSGVPMTQIPYKGVAPMMQDLLSGQIALGWDNLSTCLPFIQSGKVNAVAIASRQRVPELSNVPTFEQVGFDNMEFGAWFGLSGPKSLPPALAQTIAHHVAAVQEDPVVKQRFKTLAIQPLKSKSPAEYANYVDADIARWRAVVALSKVQPES